MIVAEGNQIVQRGRRNALYESLTNPGDNSVESDFRLAPTLPNILEQLIILLNNHPRWRHQQ